MPKRPYESRGPSAVPIEFSGKWIAWNRERTEILASASSFQHIWELAQEREIESPVFEKVLRADVHFVG